MNRWLFVIVTLFGVWWISYSFAQSPADCHCLIKGIVKDRETQKPIVGAVLIVQNTRQMATTDTGGRYKIENICQGKYVLECRIIGYKTTKTTIYLEHNAEENLQLNEEEVHLQDVEITARRIQSPLSQKTTTLQGQRLYQTLGQTLSDVLKNISGVTMLQTGATISKPVIHGLHSNRVLIMNNDIRQEGQQWGSEHAPEIDPFIAKRITIVKGAAGVRYGADAIAGVVLIEPNELPKSGPIKGEVNTAAFSNGRMRVVSGTLEGSLPKWKGFGWRIQGTIKGSGNIRTPDYFLANTGVKEENFSVAVGYRNTKMGIEAFYSQFHTNLGIFSGSHIGSTTDLLEVIQKGEPFIKSDFFRAIENPKQEILHNLLKIKTFYTIKGNRLNLLIGRQFNRRAEYDLHRTQDPTKPTLLFRLTSFTGDLTLEHKPLAGKINGQLGLNGLYQYNFNDGRPLIPDFEQANLGLFVIERYIHQQWELEAGFRYDWRRLDVYRFLGSILNPSQRLFGNGSGTIGLVHNTSNQLSLRLNISTAWRPPNINELYSKGVHHGAASYEEGNDQLQPEVAYNLTGSAEYTHKRFRIELGAYHNAIQNFIYLQPQVEPILTIRGAFPYFKYVQTQATFTGFDLDTAWEIITKKLTHTSKIAYLQAYDRQQANYLVLIPANRIENKLRWQLGKLLRSTDTYFEVGHLWVDQQRRVPPNSDFALPPAAYHLWSLNMGGDINLSKKQTIQWTIQCQNLLNNSYRDYLNRFRYYALEQGRNVSVRLRYSF